MQCTDFPKNPEGYAFKCYRTLDAKKLKALNFDTIDWLYQRLQQIGKNLSRVLLLKFQEVLQHSQHIMII